MNFVFKSLLKLLLIFILSNSVQAVEFSLFGDLTANSDENTNTFSVGALDLIAKEEISDSTEVTAELLFEPEHHDFEIDIERFNITKSFNDLLKVTAGKMLKPLGLWNHNYNHSSMAQQTVSQPFFLEFEGRHEGAFPAHLVGINLNGETRTWSYQLAVGNSTGMDTRESGQDTFKLQTINTTDTSSDKTWVFRGTYRPANGPIELGILAMETSVTEMGEYDEKEANSGDKDRVKNSSLVDTGETLFNQTVLGLDFNIATKRFYALAEYYHMIFKDNQDVSFRDRDDDELILVANKDSYNTTAYYLQVGYHITDKLTASIRYAALDFDVAENTYFKLRNKKEMGIDPETRTVFALSYRLEESNALRFEVNNSKPEGGDSNTSYTLQWFFLLL